MTLKPRQKAPFLEFPTLDGGAWRLSESRPAQFTMVVVYRGLHCPVCRRYLTELQEKLPEFEQRGALVIAVSADDRERAEKSRVEWGLDRLKLGYALPIATARNWGLFISTAIRNEEPPVFSEPGLFLIKPDGALFAACVGNAPWTRPPLSEVLTGIDRVVARGSPARGEA